MNKTTFSEEMMKSKQINEETDEASLVNYNEPYKNTPLRLVKTKVGWAISLGTKAITPLFSSREETEEHFDKHMWMIIINICSVITNATLEMNKEA